MSLINQQSLDLLSSSRDLVQGFLKKVVWMFALEVMRSHSYMHALFSQREGWHAVVAAVEPAVAVHYKVGHLIIVDILTPKLSSS